jgi:hypothetical protein
MEKGSCQRKLLIILIICVILGMIGVFVGQIWR